MKTYKLIYYIKNAFSEIKIFNKEFVYKYKNKCKIIFKNKIYPLQTKFTFEDKISINEFINLEILKKFQEIKLISFTNIPNINDIVKGCSSFDSLIEKNRKFKLNINKYDKIPKY